MSRQNTCRAIGWSLSISIWVWAVVYAMMLLSISSYKSPCISSSEFRVAFGFLFVSFRCLRWPAFSHVLGSWPACCCRVILFVLVPGLGLRGSGGGGSGGSRGLWDWLTLSSSSRVVTLPALILFLVRNSLSSSPAVPKVVWRTQRTVFAQSEGVR